MRIPDNFNRPNAATRAASSQNGGGAPGSRMTPNITAPTPQPPAGDGVLDVAWRILRRRWLVVLATAVLTTLLVVGLSLSQDKKYTAAASLLLGTASENVLNNGGYVDTNRRAATTEQLLELDVVAQATSERINGRLSASNISDSVEIVTDPSADVVQLRATTEDPELSALVATEYGRAFKEFRQTSARSQIQDAIDLAKQGQATMTREQRLGPEGEALRQQINQLETAKFSQTGGVEPVQAAVAPTDASSPKPLRNGILGLVLGGILGFALAALLERSDRGVKTVEELERVSGWPVLARIPSSRSLSRGTDLAPRSVEAEAFRMLRASLRYFSVNTEIRSLLVTSARSGEGKSTTARHLAEAMAAMGDRVVLLEADMHRHAKTEAEVGSGERGLSGYLVGMELNDVLLEVPVGVPDENRTLTLLPSGPLPPNPTELLESDRMHELMERLEDHFDMVIVDSPPLPVLSDAITLVGHVSGIIVVTAVGVTTSDDIRDVSRLMGLHGAAVLGVVANFAPGVDRIRGYYGKNYQGSERDGAGSGADLVPASRRKARSGAPGRV
jgi:capsular exopolysaccharide synthesis family protein